MLKKCVAGLDYSVVAGDHVLGAREQCSVKGAGVERRNIELQLPIM